MKECVANNKALYDSELMCYDKSRETLFPYLLNGGVQMSKSFINDARVMSKGQVTIPKNVRAALGISTGDRVTFIVDGTNVRVVNSAVYALERLQELMKGRAQDAGFLSEEDIAEWITMSRRGESHEESSD